MSIFNRKESVMFESADSYEMPESINPYETYITKLYRTIPKNHKLIIRNKFSGKDIYTVGTVIRTPETSKDKDKDKGFALIAPWRESKLVSLAVRNFDYEKEKFEDANGLDVIVDLAVSVRISDPVKFEYNNQNINDELKQLISSSMRILINKSTYSDLKSKRFNVANYGIINGKYYKDLHRSFSDGQLLGNQIEFDKLPAKIELEKAKNGLEKAKNELEAAKKSLENGIGSNKESNDNEVENSNKKEELKEIIFQLQGRVYHLQERVSQLQEKAKNDEEFLKEICHFRKLLDDFSEKYGLEVVDLYNKEVQQTEDLQEAFNRKVIAEKEVERLEIEKKAERERAKIDAEIIKVRAQAEAEANRLKYEAILKVLKDSKMSPEEQARFLQAFMYSNGNQNVAGAAAAAIAGVTAGATSVQITNNNEENAKKK